MVSLNDAIYGIKQTLKKNGYAVYKDDSNDDESGSCFKVYESAFATYEDAPFISVHIVKGNEIKIIYLIDNDCCQHIIHQATVTTVNKAVRKINQYMSN